VQEEQEALQTALSEAEAKHEEVEGSLTNNLRKRQADLEILLASSVTVDMYNPPLLPPSTFLPPPNLRLKNGRFI
jgi:hypothetical protein